jgi:hypothetical protein
MAKVTSVLEQHASVGFNGIVGQLTAQITLAEDLEAASPEGFRGDIGVIHAQREQRSASGHGHEGVAMVNVDLCLQECRKRMAKVMDSISQLRDDDGPGGTRNALLIEQSLGRLGIRHDETHQSKLNRILHAESEHLDVVIIQKSHQA